MRILRIIGVAKAFLVLGNIAFGLSLFSAQPVHAAIAKFPASTAVVYLTGTSINESTKCGPGDWPFRAQNDVKLLHRLLVKEMGAVNRFTSSLNYYCAGSRVRDDRVRLELPQVISVIKQKSAKARCLGEATLAWDAGPDLVSGVEPVMRHAYHVAWQLSADIKANPKRRFVVIGHSQGVILARLVYILSDSSRRAALGDVLGNGAIRAECWPTNLNEKFYGQVYMGTPFDGVSFGVGSLACRVPALEWSLQEVCEIHDSGSKLRRILDRYRSLAALNTMQFGGWEFESVKGDVVAHINASSTTAIRNGKRFVMMQQNNSGSLLPLRMKHSDWWDVNTGGTCPKKLVGTKRFCEYSESPNNASATRKLVYKLGSTTQPGNVYDLMIRTMKNDWSSPTICC